MEYFYFWLVSTWVTFGRIEHTSAKGENGTGSRAGGLVRVGLSGSRTSSSGSTFPGSFSASSSGSGNIFRKLKTAFTGYQTAKTAKIIGAMKHSGGLPPIGGIRVSIDNRNYYFGRNYYYVSQFACAVDDGIVTIFAVPTA